MALLREFDPLSDDILFDVGHQAYTYKLLTGRWNQFSTLRQKNGISGYPDPRESKYDKFISGHSSTALSTAMGFAIEKRLHRDDSYTIAIVGDGALTGGESYEALNNIGHLGLNIIVILNDNDMSISKNVGSMARLLSRMRSSKLYHRLKWKYKRLWLKLGFFGRFVIAFTEKIKDMIKEFLYSKMIFEEMGFTYLGPIDGHEIGEMSEIMNRAKRYKKPVILHVFTKKGKGFSCVENDPVKYHSSPPFIIEKKDFKTTRSDNSYSEIFGKTLVKLAEKDEKIIGLTAAMSEGLHMKEFSDRFPNRFFDMGITEQNIVTVSGALAQKGMKPIVGIYSTFLQRGYDQIIHDCCILSLPVIFAIDRAGAVSDDGPTHQGYFDIAFLNPIPNTVLLSPSSADELEKMLKWAFCSAKQPIFIRYPKTTASFHTYPNPIELGISVLVQPGKDGYMLVLGSFMETAKKTIEILKEKGLDIGLVDVRFAKPFDQEMVLRLIDQTGFLITLEDGVLTGGFGSQVLSFLNTNHRLQPGSLLSFGLDSQFLPQMKRAQILAKNGLQPEQMAETIWSQKNEYNKKGE